MAQVMLTVIDPINGAVNSQIKLKDIDIARIYAAFRYKHADNILFHKKANEDVLEASDTIENISKQISAQEILDNLFFTLIDRIISDTHSIESKRILKEYYDKTGRIEVDNDS